ncbi:MAG: hypothetical protein RR904_03340 [Bacilli bacterium]
MSTMITVEEVTKLCNIGNGKAYPIIREVNKEIKESFYLNTSLKLL